jgi:hypothetical protein
MRSAFLSTAARFTYAITKHTSIKTDIGSGKVNFGARAHAHTHTRTHAYIYIYIYMSLKQNFMTAVKAMHSVNVS